MTVRKRPVGLNIEIYKNYIDQELKIQKFTRVLKTYSKKTWSSKKTRIIGKAATLLVRIVKPSTPLLASTIQRHVI